MALHVALALSRPRSVTDRLTSLRNEHLRRLRHVRALEVRGDVRELAELLRRMLRAEYDRQAIQEPVDRRPAVTDGDIRSSLESLLERYPQSANWSDREVARKIQALVFVSLSVERLRKRLPDLRKVVGRKRPNDPRDVVRSRPSEATEIEPSP